MPSAFEKMYVQARRCAFKRFGCNDQDLTFLHVAVRDWAESPQQLDKIEYGQEALVLHAAAGLFVLKQTADALELLDLAGKVMAKALAEQAEAGSDQADPTYWWEKGQYG